jgi:hypothetical protein
MGKGQLQATGRLLGSGFFGNALFAFSDSGADFGLDGCFDFNGFGFTIGFSFNRFNSGFGFHDFGFGRRFTSEGDAREKNCSGSASKQFRHWSSLSLDSLPGGIILGLRALAERSGPDCGKDTAILFQMRLDVQFAKETCVDAAAPA